MKNFILGTLVGGIVGFSLAVFGQMSLYEIAPNETSDFMKSVC